MIVKRPRGARAAADAAGRERSFSAMKVTPVKRRPTQYRCGKCGHVVVMHGTLKPLNIGRRCAHRYVRDKVRSART